jgi:hypothetical protein
MLTHIRFAIAFQDGFSSGQFFPSWANDNFGYGSIGIRFYPPLSAYTLAVVHVFANDWVTAFLISLFAWMCAGCIGVYLFVKDWGTPGFGLLAAMLYAVVPHHLAEIFQFFLYAEFAAWAVIPFCFLFVSRICRGGTWIDVVLFALSFSILILTHIPTTIIILFCLPIYVLLLFDWSNYKRIFLQLATATALALLATAFRWVMLVNELTWLAHNGPEHFMSGFYDFRIWLFPNFLVSNPRHLYILTSWFFDVAVLLTVALLIPAVISLVWRTSKKPADNSFRKFFIASLVTAIFAFFMLSRLSYFVWNNIEVLQKIQFPSRWMSVLSMFSVVLFSLSIRYLMPRRRIAQRLVVYPAIALILAILIFDLTQIVIPSAPIPRAEFTQIEQKIYTEQIWKGWWPTWAREKAFDRSEKVIAGGRNVEIAEWVLESKEFVVQPGDAINVRVKILYYPHWKATVNDRVTEIGMDENGAITIPVSSEASKVSLHFVEPFSNGLAHVVSLVTWLLPVGLLLVVYGRQYVRLTGIRQLLPKKFDLSKAQ